MPEDFHKMLVLFFSHCYKQQQIPTSWKISLTILLYKKSDPSQLTNHRPIALANTIYKLFISTLTFILSAYGEKHQILHDSQEEFRAERSTSRQLQLIIATLEDVKFTKEDIYIQYVDFKNALQSIQIQLNKPNSINLTNTVNGQECTLGSLNVPSPVVQTNQTQIQIPLKQNSKRKTSHTETNLYQYYTKTNHTSI